MSVCLILEWMKIISFFQKQTYVAIKELFSIMCFIVYGMMWLQSYTNIRIKFQIIPNVWGNCGIFVNEVDVHCMAAVQRVQT